MGPRSPLTKTSWATRRDDRYLGYISLKTLRFPGRWTNFFGRHKFRVSARRKLESWGSDFFRGGPCRSDRAYCSRSIKNVCYYVTVCCWYVCHIPNSNFLPVDTEICVFHWKNGCLDIDDGLLRNCALNKLEMCIIRTWGELFSKSLTSSVVDWGPQQERWSQWSPSCNGPLRHLEEAWSSNIDKEHRGFNDFLEETVLDSCVHNVFILFDELRRCHQF